MKILAVRLREVGPFINGVALEGLTGRLDVLAGPNELGKSTLFRALQTAFFESHATTSKDVERLRPYSGGAPLIEVDFATQEGVWRIRKQFLASKSATLIDLASNRVAARGKEAETRLNELIGMSEGKRGDFGRFALLWVAQMASLGETKAEGAAASALHAAIGREVETVAGGASARQIRDRVQSELSELVTPKTGKPTGRFAEARTEHDRLSAELRDAEEAEQRARTRVARLETLRAQRNALADPAALARLTETVSASGSAHEAGKQAAQALQLANARLKSAEQAVSEAQRILDAFDRAIG